MWSEEETGACFSDFVVYDPQCYSQQAQNVTYNARNLQRTSVYNINGFGPENVMLFLLKYHFYYIYSSSGSRWRLPRDLSAQELGLL